MQESETLRKDGGALSNKRPPRILVVDDDSRLRDLLRQFLTNNGFHVSVAENAEQMNRLWLRERFDCRGFGRHDAGRRRNFHTEENPCFQ